MDEIKINQISMGERVRLIRERKGWLQKELAEKSGLSVQTISNIENGKASPSASTVKKIADVLQVPPTVLFEDDIKRKKVLRDELRKKMILVEGLIESGARDEAKKILDEVIGLFKTFGEEIQTAAVADDKVRKTIQESALPEASKEILLYLYQSLTRNK